MSGVDGTAIWFAAFAAAGAAFALLSVRLGLGRINPLTVYAGTWLIVLGMYVAGALPLYPLVSRTWLVLSLASLSLALGVMWGAWIYRPSLPARAGKRGPVYDETQLNRWYRWGVLVLAGSLALQFYQALPALRASGGLSSVLGGGGLMFRQAQNGAASLASQTSFGSGSALVGVVGYVLFLGTITVFWAGYLARRGRWGLALTPLLLLAAFSLFTLQRFTFIYSLLLFGFSYHYHGASDSIVPVRKTTLLSAGLRTRRGGPGLALAVVAVAVVFIPLALRAPAGGQAIGGLKSVILYVVAGLGGLNTHFIQGHAGYAPHHLGLGGWTFYGAGSVLGRLNVIGAIPPNVLPFVPVGSEPGEVVNVYTYLVFPMFDFGYPGLLVVPFLLGAVATVLHRRAMARSLLVIPAASILMTSLVMSFFGLSLIRDFRYLFLIAASLAVGRWVMVREETLADSGAVGRSRSVLRAPGRQAPGDPTLNG